MRVLIVEDELLFIKQIKATLQDAGIIADAVMSIGQAKQALQTDEFDAVVLDRMLPDGDGTEVIAFMKTLNKAVPPVLLLTALNAISDKVAGLDSGADDYLTKPADSMEILARVRALLRRPALQETVWLSFQNVRFDCKLKETFVDGAPALLSRVELRILESLLLRADRVVLKEHLEAAVYGYAENIGSNTLESQISRLRKKLAQASAKVQISATRGVGYRLCKA